MVVVVFVIVDVLRVCSESESTETDGGEEG